MGVDDLYECLHWGTLFDAAKRAWLADLARSNPAIQQTMRTPIRNCKVYRRDLP